MHQRNMTDQAEETTQIWRNQTLGCVEAENLNAIEAKFAQPIGMLSFWCNFCPARPRIYSKPSRFGKDGHCSD